MKAELMEKIRDLIRAEVVEGISLSKQDGIGYGNKDSAKYSDLVFAELLEMCSGKGRL